MNVKYSANVEFEVADLDEAIIVLFESAIKERFSGTAIKIGKITITPSIGPMPGQTVDPGTLELARSRVAAGYTQAHVARSLGLDMRVLAGALNGKEKKS